MKTKRKQAHAPTRPNFIESKLQEIHNDYFLNDNPALVDVNAPRALMQSVGEGWAQGIRWVTAQPLYAAAPRLLAALENLVANPDADDAIHEAVNAIAQARGQ